MMPPLVSITKNIRNDNNLKSYLQTNFGHSAPHLASVRLSAWRAPYTILPSRPELGVIYLLVELSGALLV